MRWWKRALQVALQVLSWCWLLSAAGKTTISQLHFGPCPKISQANKINLPPTFHVVTNHPSSATFASAIAFFDKHQVSLSKTTTEEQLIFWLHSSWVHHIWKGKSQIMPLSHYTDIKTQTLQYFSWRRWASWYLWWQIIIQFEVPVRCKSSINLKGYEVFLQEQL